MNSGASFPSSIHTGDKNPRIVYIRSNSSNVNIINNKNEGRTPSSLSLSISGRGPAGGTDAQSRFKFPMKSEQNQKHNTTEQGCCTTKKKIWRFPQPFKNRKENCMRKTVKKCYFACCDDNGEMGYTEEFSSSSDTNNSKEENSFCCFGQLVPSTKPMNRGKVHDSFVEINKKPRAAAFEATQACGGNVDDIMVPVKFNETSSVADHFKKSNGSSSITISGAINRELLLDNMESFEKLLEKEHKKMTRRRPFCSYYGDGHSSDCSYGNCSSSCPSSEEDDETF